MEFNAIISEYLRYATLLIVRDVQLTAPAADIDAFVVVPSEIASVPVKVGEAKVAFRSRAVCVALDTGLLASLVLFTLPKPTMALVMPPTVPVKVGEANGALALRAVCVALDTGLLASLVLSTLPRPTMEFVIHQPSV